ncbi:hypothetical protein P4O66_001660 [Electrophorus voltai]|uniref:Uncharacterized protein n=1 Tax=Electrophorus voltai TaxID=2609070 RepID=A0AAD8Z5N4_9TELE|nr:hypothetical protein P4O66_001660 [Electrophorus voltai]
MSSVTRSINYTKDTEFGPHRRRERLTHNDLSLPAHGVKQSSYSTDPPLPAHAVKQSSYSTDLPRLAHGVKQSSYSTDLSLPAHGVKQSSYSTDLPRLAHGVKQSSYSTDLPRLAHGVKQSSYSTDLPRLAHGVKQSSYSTDLPLPAHGVKQSSYSTDLPLPAHGVKQSSYSTDLPRLAHAVKQSSYSTDLPRLAHGVKQSSYSTDLPLPAHGVKQSSYSTDLPRLAHAGLDEYEDPFDSRPQQCYAFAVVLFKSQAVPKEGKRKGRGYKASEAECTASLSGAVRVLSSCGPLPQDDPEQAHALHVRDPRCRNFPAATYRQGPRVVVCEAPLACWCASPQLSPASTAAPAQLPAGLCSACFTGDIVSRKCALTFALCVLVAEGDGSSRQRAGRRVGVTEQHWQGSHGDGLLQTRSWGRAPSQALLPVV